MTNEKLIEEAAKALEDIRIGANSFLSPGLATRFSRAALAVFEKALGEATVTPTEDEREASWRAWGDFQLTEDYNLIPMHCTGYAMAAFHAGHAAGFRRSETVSDDERAVSAAIEMASTVYGDYDDAQGALSDIHMLLAPFDAGFRRSESSKPGEHGGTIPLYGMLDVWMALYGTSHPEFDEFYAEHGYADTWARILDVVRRRRSEVPEPSAPHDDLHDDEVPGPSAEVDDPGGRLFRSRTYKALAERDFTGHMDEGRRTAFYEGWNARVQWEALRAGPQGEPSPEVPEPSTEPTCICPNTLGWHTTECVASHPEPETAEAQAYSKGFTEGSDQAHRDMQGEPSDTPAVQYMARRGGKSQALIDQMLAQANEQGIRVEIVYPQLSDDAVEVMAKHMAQAASDWNDVERGEHEHTLECTNWVAYRDDARTALRAAGEVR